MAIRILLTTRFLTGLWLLASVAAGVEVQEEIVAFTTHDGLTLEGVLSYPHRDSGPFPGLLLIAGSGLHDADVTLDEPTLNITRGTQKLFRPLARHFSREGWAVLRYNKRGASFDHRDDRPSILENSTVEDLVEDSRNALRALLEHPRVAAWPVVVYGHSEGAAVAARLAREQDEVDLLVLAASPARPMRELLEFQLVERNLYFLRQAVDRDGDREVTLEELAALDGNYGLGSVYILNIAEVLFSLSRSADGSLEVEGLNPRTDLNGDGRLHIAAEIETTLVQEADHLLGLARSGALGSYWQSLVSLRSTRALIHRVSAPILFVHGGLDVQTPIDEALMMMETLTARGRSDHDLLLFPKLGHSLSRPNDYVRGDGGLSLLDNLTLNAPSKRVRRKLLQSIERQLLE